MLRTAQTQNGAKTSYSSPTLEYPPHSQPKGRDSLPAIVTALDTASSNDHRSQSPGGHSARRQRRRIENVMPYHSQSHHHTIPVSPQLSSLVPGSVISPIDFSGSSLSGRHSIFSGISPISRNRREYLPSSSSTVGLFSAHYRDSSPSISSDDEDFAGAIGQLSLNEDDEVRYHGKASGLHLLGVKERLDKRNEGGIWCVYFCKVLHFFFNSRDM